MRLTIGKKILGGFAIILILLLIVGGIGFVQVNNVGNKYGQLLDDEVHKLNLLKDMMLELQKAQTYANSFLLRSVNNVNYNNYLAAINEYHSLYDELQQFTFTGQAGEYVLLIDDLVEKYKETTERMFVLNRSAASLTELDRAHNEANDIVNQIANISENIIILGQENMDEVRSDTDRSVAVSGTLVLTVVIITIIAGGAGAYFIGRMISNPVLLIASASREMAAGNMAIEEIKVKNNDEIGDMAASFNEMSSNLRNLLLQVGASSEKVSAAAQQLNASAEQTTAASEHIAENIQHVSEFAEKQAESADQTSQGIYEMSNSVQQIAQNTNAVHSIAIETSEKAAIGNETTQTAVQQMNSVHTAIVELEEVIRQLGEQSIQIGQFIEVISDIASQTNLLALNAAIEASRAGDEGRGFAVVADEVRKLAEQSAQSAEEITNLIQSVQKDTERAVSTANKATKEVGEGLSLTESAGKAFEEIRSAIEVVSERIGDVSASVQQISATTEQMSQSVNLIAELGGESARNAQNVSAATEEQLASMEEVNASAQSLSEMSENLQTLINRFKV